MDKRQELQDMLAVMVKDIKSTSSMADAIDAGIKLREEREKRKQEEAKMLREACLKLAREEMKCYFCDGKLRFQRPQIFAVNRDSAAMYEWGGLRAAMCVKCKHQIWGVRDKDEALTILARHRFIKFLTRLGSVGLLIILIDTLPW